MTSRQWWLLAAVATASCWAAAAYADGEKPVPPVEASKPEAAKPEPAGPEAAAPAPAAPAPEEQQEIEDDLRARVVNAAAKREQTVQTAPGVVEVITAEEIAAAGYRSVGEALQPLAGVVVYNDQLHFNVGVRGIFGGERAGSRIVKVLIDGQPVGYRSSSANFLGPEMLPIELVERIEIIRGPGSVLYGANAFLGGINVVTKAASAFVPAEAFSAAHGAGAVLSGGAQWGQSSPAVAGAGDPPKERASGFGSASAAAISGDLDIVAGAAGGWFDRSGLALPDSSPRYNLEKSPGVLYSADPYSRDDTSAPKTAYARLTYRSPWLGRVRVFGSFQQLSSQGEFEDRNTLSHDNTIGLTNAMARLDLERAIGGSLVLRLYGAYAQGSPTDHYTVQDPANPGTALRVDSGFHAVDTGLEAAVTAGRWLNLLVGTDFSWDEEKNPVVQRLWLSQTPAAPAGTVELDSGTPGTVPFRNWGAFGLATVTPFYWAESSIFRDLGITAGVRYEANSVYGGALNWRGGLVLPLGTQWYAKVLGGSSFKGPSDEELYAIPLLFGDPAGNPALKPQTATTVEAVVGFIPSRWLAVNLTGYYSIVNNQIRYRTTVAGQIPENLGKQSTEGAELEIKVSKPFAQWSLGGFVNGTFLATQAERPIANGQTVAVQPDLYPPITANIGLNLRHKLSHLGLYLEGRFLGPRPPSRDNEDFWLRGATYSLPATFILDATLSTDAIAVGATRLRALVRVTNLLDLQYALPGFYGFDVPGQPRTISGQLEASF
jgi:iron complex outermembrane receptor protein